MSSAITMYQQSLEDVLIFLLFGIGAKVIILLVIRTHPPKVPKGRIILWYGLGAYWAISSLIQMWPTMAVASAQSLQTHPLLHALAPFWGHHPVADTLWSIVIQMVLGIVLLTERENITGRIALILSAFWSFFLWIAGENWGGLSHTSASLVMGSPGAGFFALLASLALLAPVSWWTNAKVPQWIFKVLVVVWGLGTIWQLIHFSSATAWQPVWIPQVDGAEPHWVIALRHGEQALLEHNALVINLILVALMVLMEVLFIIPSPKALFWTVLAINLAAFWWLGQGFGFRPAYGANLNTAPLLLLLILSTKTHWRKVEGQKQMSSRLSA
ncbi:hypothetical protein [Sulfobacillus thermosulfidooxidans]|uniref:hypothetical protein n=1 Tax=Sulfobacillus thermosulfidooxidans TaxID=28034 RepID=UPI000B20D1B9|nr:hypothetical protein [Sulfobacillus thermosulfidooxidans]